MGFVRVMLALSVVLAHSKGFFFGLELLEGRQAVLCFYIISGFYMALILNSKYAIKGGTRLFYIGRALRLWPIYMVVTLLILPFSLLGIIGEFNHYFSLIGLPLKLFVILSNLFIIGQDLFWFFGVDVHGHIFYALFGSDPSSNAVMLLLNPPANTISIEIIFYILAPFIVKRLRNCVIAMVLGATYHIVLTAVGKTELGYHYHLFPAAFIYFSLGAATYLVSKQQFHLPRARYYISAILLIILILYTPLLMTSYFALAFAVSIPFVFSKTKRLPFDRSLGDLSYVIYLVHSPIIFLLRHYFAEETSGFLVVPTVIAVSIILYHLVEKPVEKFRSRLIERLLEKQNKLQDKTVQPVVSPA